MTEIATRWPVLHEHGVTDADVDATGTVRDVVVEAWIDAACDAYLARCDALEAVRVRHGLARECRSAGAPAGALPGRPAAVAVSASAPELRPASFTIMVRLRPIGGADDRPVNVACAVRLADPASGEAYELGDAVRDELIALEQAAPHYN